MSDCEEIMSMQSRTGVIYAKTCVEINQCVGCTR